jgi:phosphatidylglycerol:prolipoprotein diacylglycerol transferase
VPFPNIDPVLIHLGPIAIRWYAVAYIAGILLGWRYGVALSRNAKLWNGARPTLDERQIDDLVLWVTLAILIGGRVGSVLFYNTETIWKDPLEIFQPWHGGMSFHGAFIAVVLVIIWFSIKSLGPPVLRSLGLVFTPWKPDARRGFTQALRIGDLTAPCVPFGLLFGRIANFINGELWGRPTTLPWGIIFPNAGPEPRHPSELYEAGLEGIGLFVILRIATHRLKWLPRRGANTGLFFLCYGLFRIALETVREPDRNMPSFPLGLTMGMMLSIPMVIIGVWLLWLSRRPESLAPLAQEDSPPDLPFNSGAADAPDVAADPFSSNDFADESRR